MRDEAIRRTKLAALAAVVMLSVVTGCAVNPATGKRQLTFTSERDEVEIGRKNDEAVQMSLGVYEDQAVQRYVEGIGQEMASHTERSHLEWTFRVMDDPTVNAFALPGGYIYITRGIMAYLNSEAELASVVGHEIGHVTGRHGVDVSMADALGVGLQAAGLFSEELRQWSAVANTGIGMLSLKYSRGDELEADELGLRYLYRTGYDPRPMPNVYNMLGQVSEAQGGGRVPTLWSTHPQPENREQKINELLGQIGDDFEGRPVGQDSYFEMIDGVVFGQNPRDGFFDNNVFNHPDLQLRVTFPPGWRTDNQHLAVFGISPQQDAMIQLSVSTASTASAGLAEFFEPDNVAAGAKWVDRIGGFPAASREFRSYTGSQTVSGLATFIEFDGRVFGIIGYASDQRWPQYEQTVQTVASSFARLRDPHALDVQPQRLKIVTADRRMTIGELGAAHDATVPPDTLALLNQMDKNAMVEAGRSYKIVVGRPTH